VERPPEQPPRAAFIALSREHRTALIAAAVTGQIDVRGYGGSFENDPHS